MTAAPTCRSPQLTRAWLAFPAARLGYNLAVMINPVPHTKLGPRAALIAVSLAAIVVVGSAQSAPNSLSVITPIRFADVTSSSGIRTPWVSGGSGFNYYLEQMGGGAAFFDYDGDGWLDVFAAGGGALPGYKGPKPAGNRLYRNGKDGTFSDVTRASGLESTRYTLGASTADYDNDGDTDLYITSPHGNVLYRNDGHGRFADVTARAGVGGRPLSTSAAFLDYDGDGWLDLFVGRYNNYDIAKDEGCMSRGMSQQAQNKLRIAQEKATPGVIPPKMGCGPQAVPTTASRLYRNNGDGTFADVSAESGIGGSQGHALAIAIGDFNEDGRPDIFVASDGTPTLLFMNLGNGKFKEGGMRAGVGSLKNGYALAGMGADAADYDRDGHLDVVTANFEGEPFALYRGRGDGTFEEISERAGLLGPSRQFLKWGCRLLDFNGDGWRDAMVVSGHIDPNGTPGRPLNFPDEKWHGKGFRQETLVFAGAAGGRFRDVSSESGQFFKDKHAARGAAFADYDNDGDWDMFVVNIDEPAVLVRNDSPARRWARLELEGNGCNRDALGASVKLVSTTPVQVDHVRSAGSYLSDHDRRLLFFVAGTAPATAEIKWPCGAVQLVTLKPGETLKVKEASCRLRGK